MVKLWHFRTKKSLPWKIGVIEEGALADILLIDGNPLKNIEILTNPEQNLLLIMKDGKVYKNIIK
jgi:imidazolonepropionase-like amidohydrolase